jgi:hypothetical protein
MLPDAERVGERAASAPAVDTRGPVPVLHGAEHRLKSSKAPRSHGEHADVAQW